MGVLGACGREDMRPLTFGGRSSAPLTILCLGAHADDIEIGCGGTVLRLVAEGPAVHVHWVVFSGDDGRSREARRTAGHFLRGAATQHVRVEAFRDGLFPYDGEALKAVFEELKQTVAPDLVLTHRREDAHQDHRVIADLTWNTFRRHLVFEYEIPKYDGDLGQPNCFVPLSRREQRRKVRLLLSGFPSQRERHWFTESTFSGLMRLRGLECGAAEGYAEAFHARKMVFFPTA